MTVTYQVENWSDALKEMQGLWPLHWDEVATHKDSIPLAPDYGAYAYLESQGQMSLLVARCEGQMIGYHLTIVRAHLHYRQSLSGYTDMYFIHPEHRKGMVGVRLFKEAEKALRARGVQRMFTGTKLSLDMSRIFERLGWKETERLFSKYIGD